jgi:hypothetical protein
MADDAFQHMMSAAKKSHRKEKSPMVGIIMTQTRDEENHGMDMMDIGDDETTPVTPQAQKKTTLWKESANELQSQNSKRKRMVASRRVDNIDQPSSINYDRFRHLAIAMSYCGVRNVSFLSTLRPSQSETDNVDFFESCGVAWMIAYQVQDTYSRPCSELMDMIDALHEENNPTNTVTVYSKLRQYIQLILKAYNISVSSDALLAKNLTCSIDGQAAKVNAPIVLFNVKLYNQLSPQDPNYNELIPREDYSSIPFQVNKRYADILVGIWFIYHFSYLIENNCTAWISTLRRMTPQMRAKSYPTFAGATDAELAQLYVDSNRGGFEKVLETIVKYSLHISKRANEYRRKLENERKKQ